ncbi:S8 family serine peptidase [Anaeromicrobium sediminis]|uniref:Lactocepin n=1 Tax=Anaeromicrobium sediminis TaxID=1478221 RepID=A0A267MDY9_9FIRM|nr:S8 family serine peptidase [Anaeromicrobium sediminis]PAB57138.1 hypothetical protein CCE28_19605 [Anaeromicrobium sediminis]
MNNKNSRILSIIMTFVMIFTIFFGNFSATEVFAAEDNKSQVNYEEFIKESFNVDESKENKSYDSDEEVRLIVELEEASVKDYVASDSKGALQRAAQDKNLVNRVLDTQKQYQNEVKKINNDIKIRKSYSLLLNGFSMDAKYGDMEKIKDIPGVKNVTIAKTYYPVPNMNSASELANATKVWQDYGYDGEGLVVSIIDSGIDYTHKDMVVSDSTLVRLEEKDIEEMNNNSSNAKGRYYTRKIPYGYNFADNNYEIIDTKDAHGMHVAGIVGANCQSEEEIEENEGIKGVAPEVQLLAMKVFSNDPDNKGAVSDDIVSAIEDSIAHGADIINMSLGAPAGFQNPNDPEQRAIQLAVENGIVVVVSAGNDTTSTAPHMMEGLKDIALVGDPGLTHESIQVASFENSKIVQYGFEYKSEEEEGSVPYVLQMEENDPITVFGSVYGTESETVYDIDIMSAASDTVTETVYGTVYGTESESETVTDAVYGGYELVDCKLGRFPSWDTDVDDFNGIDLKNKIALIERGEIYYTRKVLNAQNHGAAGVIIYNHETGGEELIEMQENMFIEIPAVFIRHSDGVKLKSLIEDKVRVEFNGKKHEFSNAFSGEMSGFTSWGPAPNLDFKPQITGVGGNIYSTLNDDKYATYSGTSMSSPFVAGVMALIYDHIDQLGMKFDTPKEKVEFAKAMAINTATVKMDKDNPDVPYSPRRQGAGLINAKAAIENEVTVTVDGESVAALKEIGKETEFTMTLHNYGKEDRTYNVVDLSEVLTEVEVDEDKVEMMPYDVKLKGAKITFDKDEVTVKAGEKAQVRATITMDESTPKQSFAEGFIRFVDVADNAPEIGMAYMGFYGEWDKLNNIDDPAYEDTSVFGLTTLRTLYEDMWWSTDLSLGNGDPKNGEEVDPETYGINPDNGMINNVAPALSFLRNVKELTVDITDENGKVIKTVGKNSDIRKFIVRRYEYEEVPLFRVDFDNWKWDGKVYDSATGEYVTAEEGQYYVNIRTKTDIENAEDQVVTMPIKIDATKPVVNVDAYEGLNISSAESYEVEFNAEDGVGAGIRAFAFYIDDKVYYDENYKSQFMPEDLEYNEETGMYSMKLNLPTPSSDIQIYKIRVSSLDNAGNVGEKEVKVMYSEHESWDLEVNRDKEVYEVGEPITLEFTVPDSLLQELDHFELSFWDDEYNKLKLKTTGKELSYTIPKDTFIEGGSKSISIKAIDANGKELAYDYYDVYINAEFADVSLLDLKNGTIFKESNPEIVGLVTSNNYKTFKINGEEVTLGKEGAIGYLPLYFVHKLELEPGKWNKVNVDLIGEKGEDIAYAYSVAYDNQAPVLTLTDINSEEENIEVFVKDDSATYTLKGSVKDDMFGYKLSINGEVIENIQSPNVLGDESLREFEYEVPLNGDTTIIKIEVQDVVGNATTKTIKLVKTYEESKTPIKVENLTNDKTFKNGDQAKIEVKATNLTGTERPATLIVALYDENNNMVNAASTSQSLDEHESVVMSSMMNIPKEGNYTLKCFVWDTWENMKPLSDSSKYTVQK